MKQFEFSHGAPIRLRIEIQRGYKQAKYAYRLEFVSAFTNNADGKGEYWEDQGYERYAGIGCAIRGDGKAIKKFIYQYG